MPEAPVAPGIRTVRVPDGTAGRIDRFVADATGLSRSHVQKLISDGRLTVDGVPVRANALVAAGSEVRLDVPKPIELDLAPAPDIELSVVYEDADLLIVDKPAGLVVHPSPGHHDGDTLVNALLARSGSAEYGGIAGVARPGIVHRLDRETSGLMVFAKTPRAKETLQGGWDRVEKNYEAVVEGRLPQEQGTFESDLDETNPFKVFSTHASERTRHAVTHYRVLAKSTWRSLVALTLKTGRRHQIRVHLADAGCPIVGDEKYHAKSDPAKRLGLHACGLRFPHPETGKEMKFESPLPKDLARLVPLAKPAAG